MNFGYLLGGYSGILANIYMKNIFTIYGTLGRKEYFKYFAILYGSFIISSVLYLLFLEAIAAEAEFNSVLQYVALVVTIVFLAVYAIGGVVSLFWLIRRARQTSNMALWIVIGILVPFGFIVVGLIPPKTN